MVAAAPDPSRLPPVPGYAWGWLQRSRPVLAEVARRLTGQPPSQGFVEDLRARFETDPFTRDVLVDVIAEVAFGGRVPSHRPPGVSWDRGLAWWAATLAGVAPAAFDRPTVDPPVQTPLFDVGVPASPPAPASPRSRSNTGAARERQALASALRELLRTNEGGAIPASAVRQLLTKLEGD